VYNAVYGIKWAHEINGLDDPTKYSFVVSVLEASKHGHADVEPLEISISLLFLYWSVLLLLI
jgi:hypothetical protein